MTTSWLWHPRRRPQAGSNVLRTCPAGKRVCYCSISWIYGVEFAFGKAIDVYIISISGIVRSYQLTCKKWIYNLQWSSSNVSYPDSCASVCVGRFWFFPKNLPGRSFNLHLFGANVWRFIPFIPCSIDPRPIGPPQAFSRCLPQGQWLLSMTHFWWMPQGWKKKIYIYIYICYLVTSGDHVRKCPRKNWPGFASLFWSISGCDLFWRQAS